MNKNIDKKLVFGKMPYRPEDSNKATFGKILNIAGSYNYIGAAYLSSISALKAGAGYLTLACPEEIVCTVASMAPEITYKRLKSKDGAISADNELGDLSKYNVLEIGCGLTNTEETSKFVLNLLTHRNSFQNLVLDADGINILASKKEIISLKNTVITPHPKELSRLLGVETEEIIENREKYARITSQTYECITVLKGHNSIVTNGNKVFINTSGSSALAKAGSGDVLTGIIAGLLAQKLSPFDAAIIGTFLHGLAGDIAANDLTKYCVTASDIIDYLPFAIKQIILEE